MERSWRHIFGVVRLSHYREHDISGIPWGEFLQVLIQMCSDSKIKWLDSDGQWSKAKVTITLEDTFFSSWTQYLRNASGGMPSNLAQTSSWAQILIRSEFEVKDQMLLSYSSGTERTPRAHFLKCCWLAEAYNHMRLHTYMFPLFKFQSSSIDSNPLTVTTLCPVIRL